MATGLILGRFDCLLTGVVTFVPRREMNMIEIFWECVQGRYCHVSLLYFICRYSRLIHLIIATSGIEWSYS